MREFTLLIAGQDVDTGQYEYLPYADKLIADPYKTFSIIRELKQGKEPKESKKYIFAKYCKGSLELHKQAIKSAYQAGLIFSNFTLSRRRKIFDDIYKLLLQHKREYIDLLITEGHPYKLANWEFSGMEKGARKETIDFYKNQIRKEIGRDTSEDSREILYWVRRPDGVVCASAPGNAASSNSFLAALVFLTGNTLILKPPLRGPVSTIFLWKKVINEALKRNGAPPGTLSVILGNSKKITQEWLQSPLVNDLLYFGDSEVGLELGAKAYAFGKKPILELSGNDILFAWKDADIDKAADSLLDSFLASGQICMVPKVAVVHSDMYDRFVKKFLKKVTKVKVGLPVEKDIVLTPVTRTADFFDFLSDALSHGGKLLCGGVRVDHKNREDKKGFFVRPTVIGINDYKDALKMKCFNKEIFFPLLPVIRVEGADDNEVFSRMIEIAQFSKYGLRTSVWCVSNKYIRKFIKNLGNTGLLRINSKHVAFSLMLSSHGGSKLSGGPFGEMNYIWQKTSHLQGISRVVYQDRQ